MSGDCLSTAITTAQLFASNPFVFSVYPMSAMVWRTRAGMSINAVVVISPATMTRPVVTIVSQATLPRGSFRRISSRTASDIWSATLSGWPPVTDSEVNRKSSMEKSSRGEINENRRIILQKRSSGNRSSSFF